MYNPKRRSSTIQKSWLSEDRTFVLVTHRTSLLQLVDWVNVLNGGKVAYAGSKDDMLVRNRPTAPPSKVRYWKRNGFIFGHGSASDSRS